jgi:hypothetical protein
MQLHAKSLASQVMELPRMEAARIANPTDAVGRQQLVDGIEKREMNGSVVENIRRQ